MSAHFVELLDLLRRRSLRMASAVEDMLNEACEAALQLDTALARRVIARDAEIDAQEVEIEAEVIRLMALFQPMGADMRLLTTVLKVNSDLERIADCAVNIAERARHLVPEPVGPLSGDLRGIIPIVQNILRSALQAYAARDADAARRVLGQDEVIDAFYGQFIRKLTAEATRAPESMTTHLDVLSIAKNLERVADHATNIAEDVIFLATGRIVRHGGEQSSSQ
jgi:phosphate transport system protein